MLLRPPLRLPLPSRCGHGACPVRPRLARNLEKRLAQSGAVQITCIRGDDAQLAFGDEARVRLPLYSPERVRALTDDVGELGVELRQ